MEHKYELIKQTAMEQQLETQVQAKSHFLNEDFGVFGWERVGKPHHRMIPDRSTMQWVPIEFETFVFSGGEVHVKIKSTEEPISERVRINCRIKNSNDLMRLIFTVDALRAMHVEYIELFMPYIPYARQDRRMVGGEPLSIKVFSNIINNLNLNKVITYDAHSDVSTALINNIENHSNTNEVAKFILKTNTGSFTVVSPDLGAYKKVYKMCSSMAYEGQIVTASKIRNLNTGEILSTEINGDVKGANCLIVDDICDGGRTFTELAKALKDKGANELYLFVSHGIFSKGYSELMKYYNAIGTTNSFAKEYTKDITTINLEY